MERCTAKLGLVLPQDLHARMTALAARSPRLGAQQAAYALAFEQLLDALDRDEAITFPAVRGAKIRVSLRLPTDLVARIRQRLPALNLKLTDLACVAVSRALAAEGA